MDPVNYKARGAVRLSLVAAALAVGIRDVVTGHVVLAAIDGFLAASIIGAQVLDERDRRRLQR